MSKLKPSGGYGFTRTEVAWWLVLVVLPIAFAIVGFVVVMFVYEGIDD